MPEREPETSDQIRFKREERYATAPDTKAYWKAKAADAEAKRSAIDARRMEEWKRARPVQSKGSRVVYAQLAVRGASVPASSFSLTRPSPANSLGKSTRPSHVVVASRSDSR